MHQNSELSELQYFNLSVMIKTNTWKLNCQPLNFRNFLLLMWHTMLEMMMRTLFLVLLASFQIQHRLWNVFQHHARLMCPMWMIPRHVSLSMVPSPRLEALWKLEMCITLASLIRCFVAICHWRARSFGCFLFLLYSLSDSLQWCVLSGCVLCFKQFHIKAFDMNMHFKT